jgi:1,4-alpha-glucan branching enzyme
MPGDLKQHFANLRVLLGYMYAHPGKKLLFMGGEFGQWSEWKFDRSLDWHLLQYETHQGVQQFVRDLNRIHREESALHELDFDWTGFQWIDLHDNEGSTLAFLRRGKREEDYLIFACNFTPVARDRYRIGVPECTYFREILNSDSAIYDGNNIGNAGGVTATDFPWHDRPFSIEVTLPPLSLVCFKPQR